MKYYLQVQSDNTITDAITYTHNGYVAHDFDGELPVGLIGGWFKYENGQIVEYLELKPKEETDEIAELKAELVNTQVALMEFVEMVLGGME